MAHIIPPYYHHAKPVIFCFGRDFTPALPAFLRLILLLDRTICRVYDLPVWSRFAGVLRQAGRRRSVCALSVFGLLFLLPALLLTRPGTLLLADGQPLGVIEDSATLLNAVNAG